MRSRFAVVAGGLLLTALAARAASDPAPVRRLLGLLGGIEQEYGEAFDDAGTLVRPLELAEARLLLADVRDLGGRLAGRPADLEERLAALAAAVAAGASAAAVAARIQEIRATLQDATGVAEEFLPPLPPSASRGEPLFRDNCAPCHGEHGTGDGPNARTLEQPPPDFTDSAFMRGEAPSDFFRVISLGRRQAAMPSWEDALSVQQRWDLVSHLWSLGTSPRALVDGERLFAAHCEGCHRAGGSAGDMTALDRLVVRSDVDLYVTITNGTAAKMPGFHRVLSDEERWNLVAFVRQRALGVVAAGDAHALGPAAALERALTRVERGVAAAVDAYRLADEDASGLAAEAYLVFEPLEPGIAADDPSAVERVEGEFRRLRAALRQPGSLREVEARAAAVGRALEAVRRMGRPRLGVGLGWVATAGALGGVALLVVVRRISHRRPPL